MGRGKGKGKGGCRRIRAFTITELMVVIAVLAVLLGVLAPALSGVRAGGRATQCRSNMRQMAIAAQAYASIHDTWPAAFRHEQVDGQFRVVAWDWVTTLSGDVVGPGPLWFFTDDPGEVMQCPEYHGTTNFADPHTGYNYNTSYLGDEQQGATVRRGVRPHACRRGSRCAMFGDGGLGAAGTNKFMRAPLADDPPDIRYGGGQAFRHDGATNVAYVDGHVGLVQDPRPGEVATDDLLELMGFPTNGFLTDDDDAYDPR